MKQKELAQFLSQWGKEAKNGNALSNAEFDASCRNVVAKIDVLLSQRQHTRMSYELKPKGMWSQFVTPHFRAIPQLSAVLSATLLIVAALVASATPNDESLYLVKVALEKTKASITDDSAHRAVLELQLLENGVSELRMLPIINDNPAQVERVLSQVDKHAGNVNDNLVRMGKMAGNDAKSMLKIALQVNDKASFTHDALKSMGKDLPDAAKNKLEQVTKKIAKTRLASLQVIMLYSDSNNDRSKAAGSIVKDGLEKELKATMENLSLAKAHVQARMQEEAVDGVAITNSAKFTNAQNELEKAQEAFSRGKYIIALQSLIDTNELINPLGEYESPVQQGDSEEGNDEGALIIGAEPEITTTSEEVILPQDSDSATSNDIQEYSGNPDTIN